MQKSSYNMRKCEKQKKAVLDSFSTSYFPFLLLVKIRKLVYPTGEGSVSCKTCEISCMTWDLIKIKILITNFTTV